MLKSNFIANILKIKAIILLLIFLFIFSQPVKAVALPQAKEATGVEITNLEAGYSFVLPDGWGELNPVLTGMYNMYVGSAAKDTDIAFLLAAYSKSGKYNLPPILFLHFMQEPITPNLIPTYNKMFLEEARNTADKTRVANKIGLAKSVTFEGTKNIRPGTTALLNKAVTNFGFTAKTMTIPYYSSAGIVILTFFAPEDEFDTLQDEFLKIARSLNITEDKTP